ncbi:cytochrome P450 oxidoreductase OrdA-like protein [Xylariaceae sp. FL1651]|nr:cytochrome P450 oxidoreductase OrdA-like protein [Xylariaceae sp. FL1651]
MAPIDILATMILLGAVLLAGTKLFPRARKKKTGPLPPGPKGLPLVGNVADLPSGRIPEWEHWLRHRDLYGPISSVTALGTTIIILHSQELALALLEKRSSIYSSRTRLVFGGEMVGWGNTLPLQQYGKRFRAMRKAIHTMIGTQSAISAYFPLQETEVHRFLFRVLKHPDGLLAHIRTEAGAIILTMTYGYTINPHKPDPLVQLADTTLEQFSASTVAGRWLVDVIPALRYIPDWMPGAGFKRTAKNWRAKLIEITETPIRFTEKLMAEGNCRKSYVTDFYKDTGENLSLEQNYILKWTAISLYGGGADTTFFLAMTLYPEVQRKAQEEIDSVTGSFRLPTFSDREKLPYVEAIVTETWRWHPVAPMGVAHAASVDDSINGYHIPKGSIIIPNIWWFTHDPAVYPNPLIFNPSRYLGPNPAPDPRNYVFGYGRRICPGRYLADSSVWLTVAQSLAVFVVGKGLDNSGREIEPAVLFTPGVISHPEPFHATINPRSPKHEALILEVEKLHPWEKSNADELEGTVA